MGQSRILVAPGLRTAPRAGWRSGVGSAFAVVIGRPSLWLIGALGFALRGGVLVLLVPIVVLPTPVEARLMLGENLGSSGLTQAFIELVAVSAALLIVPLALALVAIAYLELAMFERMVNDEETAEHREDRHAITLVNGQRQRLIGSLVAVQTAAVVLLAAAALPLANAVMQVTTDEILRPTDLGGSIYLRVLGGVREPLLLFAAGVVIVELLAAAVSRQLLICRFGLAAGPTPAGGQGFASVVAAGLARVVRRPLTTVATAAAGWGLTLAVLAPVLWSLLLAWDAVRSTYLATSIQTDLPAALGLVLVTIVLAAVLMAGMVLCGLASALRAGMWTMEGLRRS